MTHQASELVALMQAVKKTPPLLSILAELQSPEERIAATCAAKRLHRFLREAVLEEAVRAGMPLQMERMVAVWEAAMALTFETAREIRNDSPSLSGGSPVAPTPDSACWELGGESGGA